MIFFAATAPSLIACCAVGGYGLPVFGSIINAQSPSANTPLYFGTSKYLSTMILPLLPSCVHDNLEISDVGPTPCVCRNYITILQLDTTLISSYHSTIENDFHSAFA
jgi:hypothetical protein